jgi:hypothetical protein
VREKLVKILKGSNLFLEVLKGHVQSYVKANGMDTGDHGSKSKQPINSSADHESAAAAEGKKMMATATRTRDGRGERGRKSGGSTNNISCAFDI